MNLKEFAKMLDGKVYGKPLFTKKETQIAENNGWAIIYATGEEPSACNYVTPLERGVEYVEHADFTIYKKGKPYCVGAVFKAADAESQSSMKLISALFEISDKAKNTCCVEQSPEQAIRDAAVWDELKENLEKRESYDIDEAIKYEKRVAEENINKANHIIKSKCSNEIRCWDSECEKIDEYNECGAFHNVIAKWLQELKEFQQLEEQGRLIKLPCKVGDTVYHFCEEHGRTLEYGVEKITTTYSCSAYIKRNEGCASECADVIEPDISEFGETVFLTKSEEGAKRQELIGKVVTRLEEHREEM